MIVCEYKFDNTLYDLFPIFNNEFTYTHTDVVSGNETTRTIESDSLPTQIKFGNSSSTDREKSLLEILEMDISSVINMNTMFQNCSRLTQLDVSNWDTSQVTSMSYMFDSCSNLTQLDVSNWDTSQVTNMSSMFNGCSSLTQLDISNWDTSKVTNTGSMFQNCSRLTQLDMSEWNTSQVTSMTYMFNGCSKLTQLDVSKWDTSKVTNMNTMFNGCSSLTQLDISNWDTSKVTNMSYMFNNCSSLTQLDLSNWDTSKVTTMSYMFNGCSKFTQLDLSNWDASKVTSMSRMFNGCSNLTQLDVSNWDTSEVTNMSYMFQDCSNLTQLDVSNWDTSKITDMNYIFRECFKLTQLDVSNWDTSKVINMENMFYSCSQLTQLDLSNWDTSQVTNMSYIFSSCSNLTTLDISNWNMSSVTNMNYMFSNCDKLANIGMLYCDEDTMEKFFRNSIPYNNISSQIPNAIIWVKNVKTSDYVDIPNIFEYYQNNQTEIYLPQPLRKIGDVSDKLYWDYDKKHYCIEKKIGNDYTILVTSEIIDLPHLNKKCLLDIYEGTTYSKSINTQMQPSKITLKSEIQRYKDDLLLPSTEYTLQFNCIRKSDMPIKVRIDDMCYEIFNVEIGVNHFNFTTPSSIIDNNIIISGKGNTISDVMLMKGNVKQYPNYFEGILGVGTLQEDGNYEILIECNNYDYYWREL